MTVFEAISLMIVFSSLAVLSQDSQSFNQSYLFYFSLIFMVWKKIMISFRIHHPQKELSTKTPIKLLFWLKCLDDTIQNGNEKTNQLRRHLLSLLVTCCCYNSSHHLEEVIKVYLGTKRPA